MSKPSTGHDQHAGVSHNAGDEQESESRRLENVAPTLATPLRVASFWGAIILPVCYLPVLANGLSTSLEIGLFLGLLGLNLIALYVGHAHRCE